MSDISDNIRKNLQTKRSHVHAALVKIVLSAENAEQSEKKNCMQEIINGCYNVLLSRDSTTESAEPVGEMVAKEFIHQSDVLGDIQNALAHTITQDLAADEILWLQPKLVKVLADMANGYCRMMKQEELKERADIYASYAEQMEKSRMELNELRTSMDAFVSLRMREFMETNFKLEKEIRDHKKARAALADREKKYHTLFDTIHNAIFLMDGHKIIDCNQSSTKIFGLPKGQLINRQFHTLFSCSSDDQQSTSAFIEEYIQFSMSGQAKHFELNYCRPDHAILNFDVHFSRIQESEGWHILAVVRDITQHKKAAEAIRTSESRFRDIIRRSLDGYFFIDVSYHLTQLNRAGEKILTFTKEELNERLLSKLAHIQNRKLYRLLKQAMAGRSFAWEEFDYIDKNGEPRWVAINIQRVHNDGTVLGVEGFIKDITGRKKIEIELVENEARYRALFENTPFDVFGLTLDRRFLKINQNFQRNWGSFEGKPLQSFRPSALARHITELCEKVIIQQKTMELNCRIKSHGVFRYFRIILAPIDTAEKVMIGFVGLIIDTTDTAIALDEKKTFAEKLIQTSEEEQRRISRDIHDSLGQSLFALQLDISAVKSNLRNDTDRAKDILENSETLLSTLMKETSNLCYRLSPRLLDDFGIVEALEDLVANIETTGVLHIDFEKKWIKHKKDKSLETALYRVAQESLANILKHAQATRVIIRLHKNDEGVSLSIHDNGKGFDLQSALKRRKKGFGLINMKERIDIIGGTLTLQTAPNKGTKIDINVPARARN